ncbi:MAG: aldehyde dehydrogenase family protein [Burkholderiales bacterium]|nr:MAG: aldehyde dehydrogenase family protein [Betaproteobacteria bacterium]TAG84033.1 MAG: aldehyde dehydrogenase family protein [Burkholderiales bacterium]
MTTHFINNQRVAGSNGETIPVLDPSTGHVFAHLARGNAEDIRRAVKAARTAADGGAWSKLAPVERGRLLMKLSNAIAAHHDELAALEMRDCGKPVKQAKADATACARYFEFYAGACDKLHGETIPYTPGFAVMSFYEPHGVTGHIIPWNYPMQIFGRSVGGALAAGNACVVKPAEDACLSLLRIAEIAAEVGFPEGALNIVTGFGHEAGQALADAEGIDHISFTGSARVGTIIAQSAAKRHVPVTLELGGKSPQIVFADANLDEALPVIINAIIQNAGQTCSAGSRLLVQSSAYERVLEYVAQRIRSLHAGPATMDLDLGPLIRANQLERVNSFLTNASHAGLRTLAQGSISPDAPASGFYAKPTLIADVPPDSMLAQDEVFGPVLAAMPFDDEADAIRIANATQYGLVAGVWTENVGRAMRVAKAVKSGQVFINNYGAGGGVELPFGGVKSSGYGREKGFEALYGFSVMKTVVIKHG